MEALRKTARFQTENEGGVRGGIRPQGQERNGQQQRRAREGGAKVVKRNAKGHPTTGAEMRAQEEDDNGTRRFQLSKSTTVGGDMGTEESRPIAVQRTFCSDSLWSVPQRQLTGDNMESHGDDTFRFARRREDALRNHHAGQWDIQGNGMCEDQ